MKQSALQKEQKQIKKRIKTLSLQGDAKCVKMILLRH